jgi:hypothetical protein
MTHPDRSDTLQEIAKAISTFQGAMSSVTKSKTNPFFQSTYADLDSIWDACRAHLKTNGLSLIQTTAFDEGGDYLTTTLLHISGEYILGRYRLSPVKPDPQSMGSAMTYARRYAMSAILGVSADDDDDGERSMGDRGNQPARRTPSRQVKEQTPDQQEQPSVYCEEHGTDWFRKGRMKGYAHPIGDTGQWCNMPALAVENVQGGEPRETPRRTAIRLIKDMGMIDPGDFDAWAAVHCRGVEGLPTIEWNDEQWVAVRDALIATNEGAV